MNAREKAALRANHLALIDDLDAKDIVPVLFQNFMIDDEQYEEICESNLTRRKLCSLFLLMICKPNSKCTFEGLLQALRYKNGYTFLANKLVSSVQNSGPTAEENDERDGTQENDEDNRVIILEPVRKVNVFTSTRKKMARLAHELKRLSHDGQADKFGKLTGLIHKKFKKQKFNLNLPVGQKMEMADMRFTALEAEASAKRVKYDFSLCETDAFKEMVEVIPFTSNPRVSSMTYLARFGSSVGMSEGTDPGLAYLQYAKQHSEYVTPCKDTGMVYYIEVNLLSQKYEAVPSDDLKHRVLQTTQYAMSQFESESEEVKTDYQRMLMLKMVYCYLGLGLFCKRIQKVQTTPNDIEAAKNCLDFIEKPDVWNGLEKRRKMLFLIAKSEYYRQIGSSDLAKIHAKESRHLARDNGWKAELPNIENIVRELEERKHETQTVMEDDFVQNLIEDLIDEEDSDEVDEINPDSTPLRMGTLKEGAFNDTCRVTINPSEEHYLDHLKSFQCQTDDECKMDMLKMNNAASRDKYKMDVLKENTLKDNISDTDNNLDHISVPENTHIRMDTLKERVIQDDQSVTTNPAEEHYLDHLKSFQSQTIDECRMNTLKISKTANSDKYRMDVIVENNDFCKMNTLKANISDTENKLGHISIPENTHLRMDTLKEGVFHDTQSVTTNPPDEHYLDHLKSFQSQTIDACKMNTLKENKAENSDKYRMDILKENNDFCKMNTLKDNISDTDNNLDHVSIPENTHFRMDTLKEGVFHDAQSVTTNPTEGDYDFCKMNTLTDINSNAERFDKRIYPLTENLVTSDTTSRVEGTEGCQIGHLNSSRLSDTQFCKMKTVTYNNCNAGNDGTRMCTLNEHCIAGDNCFTVGNTEGCSTDEFKGLSFANTGYYAEQSHKWDISRTQSIGAKIDILKENNIMVASNFTPSNTDILKMNTIKDNTSNYERFSTNTNNLKEGGVLEESNQTLPLPDGCQMNELKVLSHSTSDTFMMDSLKEDFLSATQRDGTTMAILKESCVMDSHSARRGQQDFQTDMLKGLSLSNTRLCGNDLLTESCRSTTHMIPSNARRDCAITLDKKSKDTKVKN